MGPSDALLVDLFDRYNQCFYDRDVATLRSLYVADDRPFLYFDNHPDCDSDSLEDHLDKVSAFVDDAAPVPLDVEVLATSVHGQAGCLVAKVRYTGSDAAAVRTSMFAELHQGQWRIRHLHFSFDPNEGHHPA